MQSGSDWKNYGIIPEKKRSKKLPEKEGSVKIERKRTGMDDYEQLFFTDVYV